RRTGALNPLTLEVVRDLAANELAVPGVLHRDLRTRDDRLGIEEGDVPSIAYPRAASHYARLHDRFAIRIERGHSGQRGQRFRREDVGITGLEGSSDLERSRWHSYR